MAIGAISPSKELTKEEQAKELLKSPQWSVYVTEVERFIVSVTAKMDTCKVEEISRLQGEKQGLLTALKLITEIK